MSDILMEIFDICKPLSHITYNDASIYLIDEGALKKLLLLENKVKTLYTGRTKNPFSKYAKIINPKMKASKYGFYMRTIPRIIRDEQKVFESIDKEFELFKNILLKELEAGIENNLSLPSEEVYKMKNEVSERILKESEKLNEIKKSFSEYEVIITNYQNIRAYPAIHFTGEDKKHYVEHLSIRVPNFLYYEESFDKDSKSNAYVKKFIKEASILGNTIYYRKK